LILEVVKGNKKKKHPTIGVFKIIVLHTALTAYFVYIYRCYNGQISDDLQWNMWIYFLHFHPW